MVVSACFDGGSFALLFDGCGSLLLADSKTSRVDTKPPPETMYLHGVGDLLNIFFYMLVWIIVHAMLQEYLWEVIFTTHSHAHMHTTLSLLSQFMFPTQFIIPLDILIFSHFHVQRMSRRLHLSKSKTAKYLDSGMLVVFYALSLVWGVDHIIKVRLGVCLCPLH